MKPWQALAHRLGLLSAGVLGVHHMNSEELILLCEAGPLLCLLSSHSAFTQPSACRPYTVPVLFRELLFPFLAVWFRYSRLIPPLEMP